MINFKQLRGEPLVRGSFIALVGAILVGFGNYLFQVLMGRMLSPSEFGALASLLSLSIILTVPNQAISLTTTKFVAKLFAKGQIDVLPAYARNLALQILPFGVFLSGIVVLLSAQIEHFLNLHQTGALYILALCFLFSFFSPLELGIYRGLQNFAQSAIAQIISVIIKIVLATILVFIGFGVNGALWAYFVSILVLILYVFINLKLYRGFNFKEIKTKINLKITSSAWITLLVSFCLIAFYNFDVILVKHFMSASDAGHYALISLAGKIIIFITSSVSNVMFPIATNNYEKGKSNLRLISMSALFITLVAALISLLYALTPKLIIKVLFGAQYLGIANLLWLGGVIFGLYSIINFFSLYFLSIQKSKFSLILALGVFLEIISISLWHNNIQMVLYSMLFPMIFMFISLFIYYFVTSKTKKILYEENIDHSTNI